MNMDYDKQLEKEIDRQLRDLPELTAPTGLIGRVMREIAARAQLPWYRQTWQSWPLALQALSLLLFLAMFAGLSFGGWKLTQTTGATEARMFFNGVISELNSIWSTLSVLLGALVLSVKKLGTGFMIGCLAAVGLAYASCIGLSAAYFRLAITGRRGTEL
jgi:hypothetical protein